MLSASQFSRGVQLVGTGLGGSGSVEQLQQALTALANAAGWPAANPGAVTGTVTPQTVTAVASVIANLSGKIDSNIKTAIQVAAAGAAVNSSMMGAATNAITSYASYLLPAVAALTAKYTKSIAPPVPPAPPIPTSAVFAAIQNRVAFTKFTKFTPQTPAAQASQPLPAGAIQARTKAGLYRVAVPAATATGLGGPGASLGAAFFELAPRATQSPTAQLVSETELEAKTGSQPFYKKPLYLAAVGGTLAAIAGGVWYMKRG